MATPFLLDPQNRNFLKLWLAQLISQFGDRMHQLALVGLIAQRSPGSTLSLAKILAFTILPVFIVQPIAGVLVDRWDRKTTLFVCDLVRGLLVLMIPLIFIFWQSMIPLYIIVFLAFCFSRFYNPAKMAIMPNLVDQKNLLMANSLVATTGMIAFVLGCALGGFLIDWFGPRIGFLIDAISFFISAIFILSIRLPLRLKINALRILKTGKELVGTFRKSLWEELQEGFRYLAGHREIRFIVSMLFILLAAAGAVYVVIIVFIQQTFHSLTKDLGILAVGLGLGLFLGALAYGKWGKKWIWYQTIFFSLVFGGCMLLVFSLGVYYFPVLSATFILAFLLGLVIGPVFIASQTMIHLVSAENMRGKVFSGLEVVIHFAFLVAMFISSWLSEFIGRVWILIFVGIIFALVGIIGFLCVKKGSLAQMR